MTCRLRSCGRASDQMRVRGGGLAGELGTPENSCVTGAPSASRRAETMPYACGASTAAKPPAPQTKSHATPISPASRSPQASIGHMRRSIIAGDRGGGHLRRVRCMRNRTHRECRSEEHTPELQSLMRTTYAVFCLKKTHELKSTLHNTNTSFNI